jgi:hypothetical protein
VPHPHLLVVIEGLPAAAVFFQGGIVPVDNLGGDVVGADGGVGRRSDLDRLVDLQIHGRSVDHERIVHGGFMV